MSDPDRDRFVQQRLHWRVACELFDDGLVYEQRSLLRRISTRVPFESIPDDPVRETRISPFWAGAVTVSFAALLWSLQPLAVAGGSAPASPIVLSLVALGFSVLCLRARSGHFVVFPCEGKRIVFFDDRRAPGLAKFLDHLQLKKTSYLSETYGPRPTDGASERPDFAAFDETEDDPSGYRH